MLNKKIEFIKNAGASIVSKNILTSKGTVKWILREESVSEEDNGWRFFSDIDTDDYINNPSNLVVCDFNTVAKIEPALLAIYSFPVGSDLQLIVIDNKIKFWDNVSDKEVILYQ